MEARSYRVHGHHVAAVRLALRRHRTTHQQLAAFQPLVLAGGDNRAYYFRQDYASADLAAYAPAFARSARPMGNTSSRLVCGRGITCTAINSPTRRAAAAPASVAALTAATSP